MDKSIPAIYELLQGISWYFGNRGFDGQCCEDLSLTEFMALKTTYDSNCSLQEIGNVLNFTKSGATRIIDRLENKGYVKRIKSNSDGRICCAPVTEKGEQTVIKIMDKNINDLDKKLRSLEPETLNRIKEALEILLKEISQ
ncbi:MAG: MarR family transcriptional regulator [Syntrophomonas sp.]